LLARVRAQCVVAHACTPCSWCCARERECDVKRGDHKRYSTQLRVVIRVAADDDAVVTLGGC